MLLDLIEVVALEEGDQTLSLVDVLLGPSLGGDREAAQDFPSNSSRRWPARTAKASKHLPQTAG